MVLSGPTYGVIGLVMGVPDGATVANSATSAFAARSIAKSRSSSLMPLARSDESATEMDRPSVDRDRGARHERDPGLRAGLRRHAHTGHPRRRPAALPRRAQ